MFYRLIVKNIGSETLVDVKVTDTTLGLDNVTVPGGPLNPGDERTIVTGDDDFGALYVENRCNGTPGNKSNVASVTATSEDTGAEVCDDNPANIRCIDGPEILLLKEVSLAGGDFVAADTAADAPVGLLGDDAVYRFIVRNIGGEDLTNIKVSDSTLGLTEVLIPDLAVGTQHVIEVGSFIDLTDEFNKLSVPGRCDSVGTLLNVASVSAEGVISGEPVMDDNPANVVCEAPVVCKLSVDKKCSIEAQPTGNLLCTSKIRSTILRYTGPDQSYVSVTFEGKNGGSTTYAGVDLVNGLILAQPSSDGDSWTVDGETTGDSDLGSKTSIFINGELSEVIHTSCSAIYSAGAPAPAPLDGNTPGGASKGDPSPNWFVISFEQKDGKLVDSSTSDSQVGADACTVPFAGGNVTYSYDITNTGSTDIDVTSVFDDKLGEQLATADTLVSLLPGDSHSVTSAPSFISQQTTNTVLVGANVTNDACIEFAATDAVTTSVEQAPLLSCDDGKPAVLVFEYTGDSCDATNNDQSGKAECSGSPGNSPVNISSSDAEVSPSSVEVGELVTLTANGKFPSQTDVQVGGQFVSFHASCSKPLNVGDQFGSQILRQFIPGEKGKKNKGSKGKK